MKVNYFRAAVVTVALAAVIAMPRPVRAQAAGGTSLDQEIPAGNNFAKAAFRLWLPDGVKTYRAVVLLMPGSNGDARAQVDDSLWRDFASRHRLALVGAQITDKPHEQKFLEEYVNVSEGSGQAV